MEKSRTYDRDGNKVEGLFEVVCDCCGRPLHVFRMFRQICADCLVFGPAKRS